MNCPIYGECELNYDAELSDVSKSTFRCICGRQVVEPEDCGTGV